MSRALVVGYGVMGERHVCALQALGHDVAVVSRRPIELAQSYVNLHSALAQFCPDYVALANETAAHRSVLQDLRAAKFPGPILVEKPLFQYPPSSDEAPPSNVFVGYNLRFHPLLLRLREWLRGRRIVAATIHAGSHLAYVRLWRQYKMRFAAQRALGGGVLRELSHELDYVLWLFGDWQRVTALGGASGALGIDADDRWSILIETDRAPQISIGLSFLDHPWRREIHVNAGDALCIADFRAGTFRVGDDGEPEKFGVGYEESYQRQHAAILSGEPAQTCNYLEGCRVLELIAAIELAAANRCWITPDVRAPTREQPKNVL